MSQSLTRRTPRTPQSNYPFPHFNLPVEFDSCVFFLQSWFCSVPNVQLEKNKSTCSRLVQSPFYAKCSFLFLRSRCLFPLVFSLASLSASRNHPADSTRAHLDALATQPQSLALQRINKHRTQRGRNQEKNKLEPSSLISGSKWSSMGSKYWVATRTLWLPELFQFNNPSCNSGLFNSSLQLH